MPAMAVAPGGTAESRDAGVLLRQPVATVRAASAASSTRISRPPAEERQRGARAFAHHRFEGCARHVDELPRFRGAEVPLNAVRHARGSAVEVAGPGGAHASDRAVVALL